MRTSRRARQIRSRTIADLMLAAGPLRRYLEVGSASRVRIGSSVFMIRFVSWLTQMVTPSWKAVGRMKAAKMMAQAVILFESAWVSFRSSSKDGT